MAIRLAALFVGLLVAHAAHAQGNLEAERTSLEDIRAFDVRVTVEGPTHLAESEILGATVLGNRVTSQMRDQGLPVTSRNGSQAHLHVHLNMMELGNGLVPFAAELNFVQEARLQESGYEMRVVTWNESVLGLVSYDQLNAISQSVRELVDQFARDFEAANR